MRRIIGIGTIAAILALAGGAAQANDKLRFLTSWRAEAEHGGFYQAIAEGIYAANGIDVELQQGGPQVNVGQVLIGGGTDVAIISGSAIALNMVQQEMPFLAVAAIFQKDPQALFAHREMGFKSLADIKDHPVAVGATGRQTFYKFLKLKYGYTDDMLRPYTFTMAPFLADKTLSQQGYVTSETYALRKLGADPQILLMADDGYNAYSSLLMTSKKLVTEKPDLMKRFVDASIQGWYGFLNGKHDKAVDLIMQDNNEYPKDQAEFSAEALKQYGIVDSGDTKTLGIGAMTDARWKAFLDMMVAAGDYKPDLDYKAAYTLQFVNKKVGM